MKAIAILMIFFGIPFFIKAQVKNKKTNTTKSKIKKTDNKDKIIAEPYMFDAVPTKQIDNTIFNQEDIIEYIQGIDAKKTIIESEEVIEGFLNTSKSDVMFDNINYTKDKYESLIDKLIGQYRTLKNYTNSNNKSNNKYIDLFQNRINNIYEIASDEIKTDSLAAIFEGLNSINNLKEKTIAEIELLQIIIKHPLYKGYPKDINLYKENKLNELDALYIEYQKNIKYKRINNLAALPDCYGILGDLFKKNHLNVDAVEFYTKGIELSNYRIDITEEEKRADQLFDLYGKLASVYFNSNDFLLNTMTGEHYGKAIVPYIYEDNIQNIPPDFLFYCNLYYKHLLDYEPRYNINVFEDSMVNAMFLMSCAIQIKLLETVDFDKADVYTLFLNLAMYNQDKMKTQKAKYFYELAFIYRAKYGVVNEFTYNYDIGNLMQINNQIDNKELTKQYTFYLENNYFDNNNTIINSFGQYNPYYNSNNIIPTNRVRALINMGEYKKAYALLELVRKETFSMVRTNNEIPILNKEIGELKIQIFRGLKQYDSIDIYRNWLNENEVNEKREIAEIYKINNAYNFNMTYRDTIEAIEDRKAELEKISFKLGIDLIESENKLKVANENIANANKTLEGKAKEISNRNEEIKNVNKEKNKLVKSLNEIIGDTAILGVAQRKLINQNAALIDAQSKLISDTTVLGKKNRDQIEVTNEAKVQARRYEIGRNWTIGIGVSVFLITLISSHFKNRNTLKRQEANSKMKIAEAESKQLKLEAEAAVAYLNPHILFNLLGNLKDIMTGISEEENKNFWIKFNYVINYIKDKMKKSRTNVNDFVTLKEELQASKYIVELYNYEMPKGRKINFLYKTTGNFNYESVRVPYMYITDLVQNACKNGIKTEDKIQKIEVTTILEENGTIQISLIDSGAGIPNNYREKKGGLFKLEKITEAINSENPNLNLQLQIPIFEQHNGGLVRVVLNQ